MTDQISISNLAAELHVHADKCAAAVAQADDRAEHIRTTQIALESARLAMMLDRWISQNTQVGSGPVHTVPLVLH